MVPVLVILTLLLEFKEIITCQPKVLHRQQLFCSSDYVFQVQSEGIANKGNDLFERFYRVSVIDSYKGSIGTDFGGTVTGNGFFMSCGPQILKKGSKYLIYAYVFNNDIRIREFYNMTDITQTDLELFRKYDCHCEIVADKDGIILQHLKHSDKCSSPIPGSSKCSYRRGYCRRNQEGVCQWQVLNPC